MRDVEIVFDAPTREWAGRRNSPTIDVYLYDIREDLRRRERGMHNVYDESNVVVSRRLPPRHFKLSYLVTAWTQRPEDEHRLLSSLLLCFLKYDALPSDVLTGPLTELGLPIPITIALPPPEDRAFADVWSALGGELEAVDRRGGEHTAGHRPELPHRATGRAAAARQSRWVARLADPGDQEPQRSREVAGGDRTARRPGAASERTRPTHQPQREAASGLPEPGPGVGARPPRARPSGDAASGSRLDRDRRLRRRRAAGTWPPAGRTRWRRRVDRARAADPDHDRLAAPRRQGLRRRLVGAGWRAEAVDRRGREHAAGHRPELPHRAARRAATARQSRWLVRVADSGDQESQRGRGVARGHRRSLAQDGRRAGESRLGRHGSRQAVDPYAGWEPWQGHVGQGERWLRLDRHCRVGHGKWLGPGHRLGEFHGAAGLAGVSRAAAGARCGPAAGRYPRRCGKASSVGAGQEIEQSTLDAEESAGGPVKKAASGAASGGRPGPRVAITRTRQTKKRP